VEEEDLLRLTAVIAKEEEGYGALCPALDVTSQGWSVEAAFANLREAVGLYSEWSDFAEVSASFEGEIFVTRLEVDHERQFQ
jgi:predicted RNase H-like HicB family nuclease